MQISALTKFPGKTYPVALYSFEFMKVFWLLETSWGKGKPACLAYLIRTCIYPLFSVQSRPFLLSPSAHSVGSIPTALNPYSSKCGPWVPAVLESPESLPEMQILTSPSPHKATEWVWICSLVRSIVISVQIKVWEAPDLHLLRPLRAQPLLQVAA